MKVTQNKIIVVNRKGTLGKASFSGDKRAIYKDVKSLFLFFLNDIDYGCYQETLLLFILFQFCSVYLIHDSVEMTRFILLVVPLGNQPNGPDLCSNHFRY